MCPQGAFGVEESLRQWAFTEFQKGHERSGLGLEV